MAALPTAPLAAGSLIAGYGVAIGSGSRPLGGAVLLAGGLLCAGLWQRRSGRRTAIELVALMFAMFTASHLLALAIGAWPSVLVAAGVTAAGAWTRSDARPALLAA